MTVTNKRERETHSSSTHGADEKKLTSTRPILNSLALVTSK
jgi:hypothetical protein